MTVADCLTRWTQAHTAAKNARYARNLPLNTEKLTEARQALLDASDLDPDLTDPAWSKLPCSLEDLSTFYASQMDPNLVLAPRFQKPVQVEQDALKAMQSEQTAQGLTVHAGPV